MSKHLVLYIALMLVAQTVRGDNNSDGEDEQKAHSRDEEPFNQRYCISSEEVTTPREEPPKIPNGGDIWQVTNYTKCILISRKTGADSWDRRCFPGNNENDYLKYDTKRDCRLMDGICYSVHRDKAFLLKYSASKPTYITPCIIIRDECFTYDRYKFYMLESNRDECYDSFCYTLKTDPENPENFCNTQWDCGRSLFNQVGKNLPRVEDNSPFPGLGEDAIDAFKEGLQTIMRENNFQGEPTGRFYSVVVLNNGSVSVMFSSTNNTQQRSSDERKEAVGTSAEAVRTTTEAVGTSAEAGRTSTEAVEKSTESNDYQDYFPEYTNAYARSSLPVFLSQEKAAHLLQALKEVLPENMLDENPSGVIYSIGVLFKNSEPEISEMKNDSHETVTENVETL